MHAPQLGSITRAPAARRFPNSHGASNTREFPATELNPELHISEIRRPCFSASARTAGTYPYLRFSPPYTFRHKRFQSAPRAQFAMYLRCRDRQESRPWCDLAASSSITSAYSASDRCSSLRSFFRFRRASYTALHQKLNHFFIGSDNACETSDFGGHIGHGGALIHRESFDRFARVLHHFASALPLRT